MKNNFQKISISISALFLIIFSVVFAFLHKQINANEQIVQNDTAKWQDEQSRRDEIQSITRSIETIANDNLVLQTHFAKSSDVVPFLNSIEKLGPLAGAHAQIDSVDATVEGNGLIIGLKATGSFSAVYKFLTLLENSSYYLDFVSVDMHKVGILDPSIKNQKDLGWEAIFKIQLLSFVP